MTDQLAVAEKAAEETAGADDVQDKTTTETGADKSGAVAEGDKAAADKTGEADKGDVVSKLPDDWRELGAGGDDDLLNEVKRYGSLKGVFKALKDAKATIRSGNLKTAKPDPSDEKAMAEWRKAEGIPDDATGYKLPDTVIKRMTDDDKPMLASFTDYAHKKGASQAVIDVASEWYFDMTEQAAEQQSAADLEAEEAAETELRKDWAHGEYKANMTLGKRYIESIPGVGENWTEARMPDGRLLGSIPEFIQWASDQGRQQFGDVTFATPDSEAKHASRKAEIEKVMSQDMTEYRRQGLDKEYAKILERESRRAK